MADAQWSQTSSGNSIHSVLLKQQRCSLGLLKINFRTYFKQLMSFFRALSVSLVHI